MGAQGCATQNESAAGGTRLGQVPSQANPGPKPIGLCACAFLPTSWRQNVNKNKQNYKTILKQAVVTVTVLSTFSVCL